MSNVQPLTRVPTSAGREAASSLRERLGQQATSDAARKKRSVHEGALNREAPARKQEPGQGSLIGGTYHHFELIFSINQTRLNEIEIGVVCLRECHEGKAPGAAQRGVVATVREMLIRYRASGGWRKQLRCDGTAPTHVLSHSILSRISAIGAFFPDPALRAFG